MKEGRKSEVLRRPSGGMNESFKNGAGIKSKQTLFLILDSLHVTIEVSSEGEAVKSENKKGIMLNLKRTH